MKNTVRKLFAALLLIVLLVVPSLATYRDQMDLARDRPFIQRVKMAAVNTAIAIQNEGSGVTLHAARSAFANRCLNNPDNCAELLAVGVANDAATFPATVTRDGQGNATSTNGATVGSDAAIDARLSAIWNAYSQG